MGFNPDVVYRAFKGGQEHLESLPTGGWRLKSAWFRVSGGVSVDDGALTTPAETYERNKPCGVASVSKAKLAQLGCTIQVDPADTPADLAANPSHRIVVGVGSKDAKRITTSAEIEVHLEGWQVLKASSAT